MPARKLILEALVVLLYVLHQDVWLWNDARPFVFGFLPVGLFYHAALTLLASLLLWALVRFAWPRHLEAFASEAGCRPDPTGESRA